MMRRRDLLIAAPALAFAAPAQARLFDTPEKLVHRQAKALAAQPFQPLPRELPSGLKGLDYDGYRELRFRREKAVWRDEGLPFQLQMFHRGGLAPQRVEIAEWVEGKARPILYSPEMFTFGRVSPGPLPTDLGFAGFRIHAPINVPDRYDEFTVFLGASYFRAVGKGDVYGLSARGLELGAGEYAEEFPRFRSFVIERPKMGATSIIVHALLDSESVTGAFRFVITPGAPTRYDVSASLFPRRVLTKIGFAPLTSMYLFGPEQPRSHDDFRPEVHDSDGLAITSALGDRIWRPLDNPPEHRITSFPGDGVKDFGLQQRQRAFGAYEDLEAKYHRRPGALVTPVLGFDRGEVRLAELHGRSEGEDNTAASWRPTAALRPGQEVRIAYRLDWGDEAPPPVGLARAMQWREGEAHGGRRRFLVEFGPLEGPVGDLRAEITAGAGTVSEVHLQPNPVYGGVRLGFELDAGGADVSDLQATHFRGPAKISETWT